MAGSFFLYLDVSGRTGANLYCKIRWDKKNEFSESLQKGGIMIYLVEDDDSIRELVIYTLRSTGMEAKGFGLPSAFWEAMQKELPDLVLLDSEENSHRQSDKRTPGDYAYREGNRVRSGDRTGLRRR